LTDGPFVAKPEKVEIFKEKEVVVVVVVVVVVMVV
jgi:hypothetical protein